MKPVDRDLRLGRAGIHLPQRSPGLVPDLRGLYLVDR